MIRAGIARIHVAPSPAAATTRPSVNVPIGRPKFPALMYTLIQRPRVALGSAAETSDALTG